MGKVEQAALERLTQLQSKKGLNKTSEIILESLIKVVRDGVERMNYSVAFPPQSEEGKPNLKDCVILKASDIPKLVTEAFDEDLQKVLETAAENAAPFSVENLEKKVFVAMFLTAHHVQQRASVASTLARQ